MSKLSLLKTVIDTATFRQSSVTFAGTVINGVLGALFYVILARALGPIDFGLIMVAIITLTLVADIADLGTDTGIVRLVAQNLKQDYQKAYRILKLALEVRILVSVIVAILGWLLSPSLARIVFNKPELSFPLQLAFIGVIGAQVFSFATSAFQAFQKFWLWSGIQISTNLVRLLLILLLWSLAGLNLISALSVYITLPLIGFLASLLFLPRGFLKIDKVESVAHSFFHYSKWVALFTLIAAISSRLDTFISARLLPAEQVGFYAAANQLVMVLPQIVGAVGTVIAPKMSAMTTKSELVSYLKKTQALVVGLALLGLLALPLIIWLIPLLYGQQYAVSVPPIFIVLFLAMLVFLISVPIHNAVFYYFGYPQLFVWVALGHLLIIGLVGWYATYTYGAIGAATTVLLGMIFNLLIPLFWVLLKLKRR